MYNTFRLSGKGTLIEQNLGGTQMKSDLQIAQEAKLKPITEIAKSIETKEDELEL